MHGLSLRCVAVLAVVVMVLVALGLCNTAHAQFVVKGDPPPVRKPLTKLGRGLANLATGWMEIPKSVYETHNNTDNLGSIVFTAPVVGVGRAVRRTGVGIVEIFTFPFKVPNRRYDPLLKPAYVI